MASTNTPTDEALVARFKTAATTNRRRAIFDALLSRYDTRIACWCLKKLGNREDAADCCQESFLRIYRGLEGFRNESRFVTWAYAIVRRCTMAMLDKRQAIRHCERVSLSGDGEHSSEFQLAVYRHSVLQPVYQHQDMAAEDVESRDRLRAILVETLTDEELEVMVLHHVDGKTVPEINCDLRLTNRSGAKALLVSAMRKLRRPASMSRLRDVGFSVERRHAEKTHAEKIHAEKRDVKTGDVVPR